MFKTAVSLQSRLYLFIGHPRHFFVQALHSALNPQENLSLTMRPDSKLLAPNFNYAAYILDADYLEDAPRLIRQIRQQNPQARILVIAKNPTWQTAREILRAGAVEILPAPTHAAATRQILEQVLASPLPTACRA